MSFLGFGDMKDAGPVETVVGSSATIRGHLLSKGTVHIDGELFGNIASEDGVIVGEKGVVHGHLSGRVVAVSGKVKGNVAGSERVSLSRSGEVMGDIHTPDLAMEDGAVFLGTSRMQAPPPPAPEDPPLV